MDNKKIILQKIKELILNPTLEKFKEVQVGDMLIQVEGEEFQVGQAVMIKTEEGFIPAGTSLDGPHLIDGVTIVISEGIITEVTQEEVATEEEEEEVEVLSEVKLQSYDDYPQAIKDAAQAVLDYTAENGWGDCGTEVGKVRANQLAKGEPISQETIQRMYSYLSRHKVDLETSVDYETGCGKLMYDAWGGEAALEWSKSKLEEIGDFEVFKIQELENKVSKLEATLVSLSDKLESYEANVSTFSSQMDKLYNNIPAIPKLEEFKTDTNDKTNVISPLESIRSFRSKRK